MRKTNDFYETPRWMTEALLDRLALPKGLYCLDPCVGDGAISKVLEKHGHIVTTNDIDKSKEADRHLDASMLTYWQKYAPKDIQAIITNPPYSLANDIVSRALQSNATLVAMLLRVTFVEPTEFRGDLLRTHPPKTVIVMPRHSFDGKGVDSATVGWFVWHKAQVPWLHTTYARPIDVVTKSERDWRVRGIGE